jgi:hypothetical protein
MRPLGIADLASSDRGSANWVGMHMDPGAASASGVADPTIRIGLAGSGGDHFPGTLLGIGNGEAHILSAIWFGESSQVILILDDLVIAGEVQFSSRKQDGYRTAIRLGSELERDRREPRFPVDRLGRITMMSKTGTVRAECRLTDMSRSGLGLIACQPAEEGCMVYVVGDFGLVTGEVRHCTSATDGQFRLGLETTGIYGGIGDRHCAPLSFLQKVRLKVARAILGKKLWHAVTGK